MRLVSVPQATQRVLRSSKIRDNIVSVLAREDDSQTSPRPLNCHALALCVSPSTFWEAVCTGLRVNQLIPPSSSAKFLCPFVQTRPCTRRYHPGLELLTYLEGLHVRVQQPVSSQSGPGHAIAVCVASIPIKAGEVFTQFVGKCMQIASAQKCFFYSSSTNRWVQEMSTRLCDAGYRETGGVGDGLLEGIGWPIPGLGCGSMAKLTRTRTKSNCVLVVTPSGVFLKAHRHIDAGEDIVLCRSDLLTNTRIWLPETPCRK